MRKNSIKHTRVNLEIQRELSRIIRDEVKDPRVGVVTSVTAVSVATDLKTCKVFISVMGDETVRSETLAALERAKGFIRKNLASGLNLRNTPELIFVSDASIEYGISMSALIDDICEKEPESNE